MMADYFGHFLKGVGSGIQTGLQIREMRWQKKERERIQKEKDETIEAASAFNKKIVEFYADKELSRDERQQLDTMFMSSAYNIQELIKGSYEAVVKLDKETEESNLALLKSYRDDWGDFDVDLRTIPELSEYYRERTVGEKSKEIFDAGDRLLQKQYEAEQAKEPELDVTERKYNWATEAYQKWLIDPKDPEGINFEEYKKYMGVSVTPEKSTGLEKSIQDIRTEGERAGIDPAKINKAIQDKILGKEAEVLTPTPTSVESLREDIKNAPTIEDARRMEKNHIAKYGDTLGIPNVDKFWSDERVGRLTSLKQGIDKLLDEKKRLKKGTITSADVGFEIEDDIQKVEAVYQQLREEYMKYRDMLEKMGVDLSQFPELMSYEEYLKADIKPGMGIFYPSTWGKQKPEIY